MYLKLFSYSKYLFGCCTERVRVVLGGGGGGAGAASSRFPAPTTRPRFVGILAALWEAFHLPFLSVL
jgi:hypothetical protein